MTDTKTCTIFYSWQSQLPGSTNRWFIKDALEKAAKTVRNDVSIDARPEIDQDTANVPGSPNIADAIRAKIDSAEAVACDVSIVQGREGDGELVRPTPNPNVLIELGYAMKSLGTTDRLLLVMNTAFGEIKDLPFDLRQYRPTTYYLPEGGDKAKALKELSSKLESTFRHVLTRLRAKEEVPDLALRVREPEHGRARIAHDARIYRHLVVSNGRRKCPAHNVRVYLKEVAVLEQGKQRVLHANDFLLKYKWEDSDREKGKPPRESTIGAELVWDLCSIGKNTNTVRIEIADASWDWDPAELKPGETYVLTFEATSIEVNSELFQVSICWDGKWDDDNHVCAENHLRVEKFEG